MNWFIIGLGASSLEVNTNQLLSVRFPRIRLVRLPVACSSTSDQSSTAIINYNLADNRAKIDDNENVAAKSQIKIVPELCVTASATDEIKLAITPLPPHRMAGDTRLVEALQMNITKREPVRYLKTAANTSGLNFVLALYVNYYNL